MNWAILVGLKIGKRVLQFLSYTIAIAVLFPLLAAVSSIGYDADAAHFILFLVMLYVAISAFVVTGGQMSLVRVPLPFVPVAPVWMSRGWQAAMLIAMTLVVALGILNVLGVTTTVIIATVMLLAFLVTGWQVSLVRVPLPFVPVAPVWMSPGWRSIVFVPATLVLLLGMFDVLKPAAAIFSLLYAAFANIGIACVAFFGVWAVQHGIALSSGETSENAEEEAQGVAKSVLSYTIWLLVAGGVVSYTGRDISFDTGMYLYIMILVLGLMGIAWEFVGDFGKKLVFYSLCCLTIALTGGLVLYRLLGLSQAGKSVGKVLGAMYASAVTAVSAMPFWAEWSVVAGIAAVVVSVAGSLLASLLYKGDGENIEKRKRYIDKCTGAGIRIMIVAAGFVVAYWLLEQPFREMTGWDPDPAKSAFITEKTQGWYWRIITFIFLLAMSGWIFQSKGAGPKGILLMIVACGLLFVNWYFWGGGMDIVQQCYVGEECPAFLKPFYR